MTRRLLLTVLLCCGFTAAQQPNTLTPAEKKAGWLLLFDGKTMNNWIDPGRATPPSDSWTIEDGCLKAQANPKLTEDLVSAKKYRDFEFEWDWKISPNGNSGVKYRIQDLIAISEKNRDPQSKKFEDHANYAMNHHLAGRDQIEPGARAQMYVIGWEYQMIDDAAHADARRGGLYQTGALYSMVPPSKPAAKPIGEWNHSRLVVRGNHAEHWLNGEKVVDTDLVKDDLNSVLAHRWGTDSPVYKTLTTQPRKECPISLQNHDTETWFRNLKIRPL